MAEPLGRDVGLDAATLRALEARLERATAAAEALLGVDGAATGGSTSPPVAGFSEAGADAGPDAGRWIAAEDAQRLLALGASLLEHVPVELQQRLAAALRELLLALRALLDWCLERVGARGEDRPDRGPEVQDIPII